MPIKAMDLFCGCGGVTYGLSAAGIRVVIGTDIDEGCRLTYRLNNPSSRFLAADLRTLSGRELLSHATGISEQDYLLLAACAPCQPFSPQNRSRNRASSRAVLGQLERLVRELRPDFLFLENVPGIQRVPGFSAFRRLLRTLRVLRYTTEFKTVDALWYGVPQTRRRLVLLASLYRRIAWPNATHGKEPGLLCPVTVREAIAKYPPIEAGQAHPAVPNHVAAELAPRNLERIRATPPDGGSRADWPVELRLSCHQEHQGHPDVYGRLPWDRPAPTLTTKCTSLSNGRFGHPEQDRAISVREAAALQGFQDSHVFYGGLRAATAQIGNAVPPILGKAFGAAFVSAAHCLNGSRKKAKWRALLRTRKSNQGALLYEKTPEFGYS